VTIGVVIHVQWLGYRFVRRRSSRVGTDRDRDRLAL
jgi:hypothetical protein